MYRLISYVYIIVRWLKGKISNYIYTADKSANFWGRVYMII